MWVVYQSVACLGKAVLAADTFLLAPYAIAIAWRLLLQIFSIFCIFHSCVDRGSHHASSFLSPLALGQIDLLHAVESFVQCSSIHYKSDKRCLQGHFAIDSHCTVSLFSQSVTLVVTHCKTGCTPTTSVCGCWCSNGKRCYNLGYAVGISFVIAIRQKLDQTSVNLWLTLWSRNIPMRGCTNMPVVFARMYNRLPNLRWRKRAK